MHKAGRPSNYFSNSNYQAEQINKEVACDQIRRSKHIVEFISNVEQFLLHTCLGHSNVVFTL